MAFSPFSGSRQNPVDLPDPVVLSVVDPDHPSHDMVYVPTTAGASLKRIVLLSAAGLMGVALMVLSAVIIARNQEDLALRSGNNQNYATTAIPLSDVSPEAVLGLAQIGQLDVNGRMQVNGALVLAPQEQPTDAKPGTVYYDKTTNKIVYFNGTDYRTVADTQNVITSVNGQSGALTLGSGLSLANGILSSSINPQTIAQLTNSTGVTSIQGQKGSVTFTEGTGISITGTTITNSGVTRLGTLTGNISLGFGLGVSGGELRSTITVDSTNGLEVQPTSTGYTINYLGAGAGGTVALGPSAPQVDSSNRNAISINATGGGGLVALSVNGAQRFAVSNTGEITVGSIDYNSVPSVIYNKPSLGVTSLGGVTGDVSLGAGFSLVSGVLSVNTPVAGNYITDSTNPTTDPYQSANLKVESKNSAYTTATLSGTTGQTADILKVKANGVAADLFSISAAGVTTFQPSVNSTASFKIFNQDATSQIFTVDSIYNRVGINKASPQYVLDVQGTLNSRGSLRIAGTEVCTVTGCLAPGDGNNYVAKSTSVISANAALVTADNNAPTVTLQATAGQITNNQNLLELVGKGGSNLAFTTSGSIQYANGGVNRTNLVFATPVSFTNIRVPTSAVGGTDTVCLSTLANCSGSGSGGVTGSGVGGNIGYFSSSSNVDGGVTALISQTSSPNTIVVSGELKVLGTAGVTIGATGANGTLAFANATNSNLITFSPYTGANAPSGALTYLLPSPSAAGAYTLGVGIDSAGTNPLQFNPITGTISCPTCRTAGTGGGGAPGVTSINGLSGDIVFDDADYNGGTGRITVRDATNAAQKGIAYFNSTNFTVSSGLVNTIQNIDSTATPMFSRLTLQGGTNSPTLGTASISLGTAGPSGGADGGIDFYNSVNGNRVRLGFNGVYPAGNINLYIPTNGGTLVSAATLPLSISASGQINLSTVGVDKGGTGNTTVGLNELLYGSGGTTMNKLAAAGSTGLCLTSAAVTFAPSWGSCAGSVGNGVTLQGAYANYDTNPAYIDLTNSLGGLVIRDNATPINKVVGSLTGSLFAVQNSNSSSTYLNVTAASTTVSNTLRIPGVSGVLKVTAGTVSGSSVSLSGTDVTGILPTSLGGTGIGGATPYTAGDLLYASGAGTLSKLSIGAHQQGECLIVTSGLPTWGACAGSGSGVTLQNAYINSPVDGIANATLIELNKVNTNNGLLLRDTAGGIGGNLFAVQSAGGGSTYLGVTVTGVSITGNLTLQGTGNLTATGATFNAANALTLGTSQAQTGGITFYSQAASSAGTTLRGRTNVEGKNAANRTIVFPDYLDASQQYYVCVGVGVNQESDCGIAGASGSFIQNQNAISQSANFYISGTGRATTGFIAPSYDAPSGSSLTIGTNATDITLQQATNVAGNITFTTGANRTLSVQTQTTSNTAGNNLTVTSAQGNGTGAGGVLTVQSGQGGTTGNGGALALQAGAGGATSGNGGAVSLTGGSATTSGAGGNVSISAGNAAGTNQNGGNVTIVAGANTGSGTAGRVTIKPTTGATNDTTNFFQVQNNAGTAILTTDTTNSRVSVGTLGTATGQLYVGGSLPTTALNGAGTATGAKPWAITAQGKYLYVINQDDSTFQIFDTSNAGSPISVGLVAVNLGPQAVDVAGKYAYVTNASANGLQIIDISNASNPTVVGTYATGIGSVGVKVSGRYAYVANSNSSTLFVLDISNPSTPTLVGSLVVGIHLSFLAISGSYIFATDSNGYMYAISISNPATPNLVSSRTLSGDGFSITVNGRYAYIPTTSNIMQIFDIRNPASIPAAVGTFATDNFVFSVSISGRYAYLASYTNSNIQVVDISNPTSPVSAWSSVATSANPVSTTLAGRYLYVLNTTAATIQSFDLGGTYTSSLETGTLEATSARVNNDLSVGGNLALQGGLTVSGSTLLTGNTGITGSLQVNNSALFKNATNSTSALTIQSSTGTNVFNVDTTGTGAVTVQSAGSTSAFRVQTSAGNPVLNVDTTNSRVSVGNLGTATGQLYVGGVNSIVGTLTGLSGPYSVAVSGRYMYVGEYNTGRVRVVDVSNPASPSIVGTQNGIGLVTKIVTAGKYVYAVNGSSLTIIDVSNPASPTIAGTLATGITDAWGVAVSGRYVYITNYDSGSGTSMLVVDVSNPATPVTVGTRTGLLGPRDVYVAGKYAYVTNEAAATMSIIDISNPASPTIVGTRAGLGAPWGVVVSGRYAYVTEFGNGAGVSMYVVDVSNPASPTIAATQTGLIGPMGIALSGKYAYVVNAAGTSMRTIDISNPAAPTLLSNSLTGLNAPSYIAVNGRYAYIANNGVYSTGTTVSIVDLGGTYSQSLEAGSLETTNLQVNGDASIGGNVSLQGGLSVAGTTLLSATGITGNLQVNNTALFKNNTDSTSAFSVQDASATPKILLNADTTNQRISVGSIGTATAQLYVAGTTAVVGTAAGAQLSGIVGVATQGRYAYIVNDSSTTDSFSIVDVSNPTSPAVISNYTTSISNPGSIAVAGRYAYVANYGAASLQIIDISNPASPVAMGAAPGVTNASYVTIVGRYAYVACDSANNMRIIDVSNPTAPFIVGTLSGLSTPKFVAVQGKYAYIANSNASINTVSIANISDPTSPAIVGTMSGSLSSPQSVAVAGRYAYVANYTGNTVRVFDVSNPAAPTGVTTLAGFSSPKYITISGRYAYVANYGTGSGTTMSVVDISNPAAPIITATQTGLFGPSSIAVSGRYAYVANNGNAGTGNTMSIIDLGGTYTSSLESGSLETTSARVNTDLSVGGNLALQGGLSVAGASLFDNNVAINGSAVLKNKTNSTKALDIQNAAGTTVATVDTTNSRLIVGPAGTTAAGTPTGQLYVSGSLPNQVGSIGSVYGSARFAVSGSYVFASDQSSNLLKSIDISNKAAPANVNSIATTGKIKAIQVVGRYAYITTTSDKLQIFDISNPSAMTLLSTTNTGSSPNDIVINGRYAYIANGGSNTIQVFNISNPANVGTNVSSFTVTGSLPYKLALSGKYLYSANNGGSPQYIQTIDISNPTSLANVGTYVITGYPVESMVLSGRYLYAVGALWGLRIYDIKNPATLAFTGNFVGTTGYAYDVAVAGRYAYLTNNTFSSDIQVVDITNPTAPTNVGSRPAVGGSPFYMQVSGRYAYLVGDGNLRIFDLGGTYSQTFESGTVETTTARVNNDASIGGSLSLQGGLTVAGASLLDGDLSVNGSVIFKNKVNSTTAFQIQNAAGTSFVTADSTTSKLTVTNLVVGGAAGNTLTVNAHIITGNPSGTTTIAAGAAACTTPTVSLTGNDTAGTITITTGTGCVATGTLATVTFASAYGAAPSVVVTPQDSVSAGLIRYATQATGNFVIGTNTLPADSTTYTFSYFVAQ